MRLRLLPIAAFVATALLTVKVTALWHGMDAFIAETFYAQPALAQSQPAAQAPARSSAQPPKQPATPDVKAGGAAPANPEAQEVPAAGSGSTEDPMLMTQSEIDLLQRLSQRRNELESWSNDLSMREQLLKAAEMRIDSKVAELKKIQGEIKSSLKQHDAEQEEKLKSLVKIYETMKPKDAARIFEQLEMPILLDVIERMKERKAAPVIADMDPEKAKKLTIEMVKQRRLAGEETQRTAEQVSRTQ